MALRTARYISMNSCALEVLVYDKGTEDLHFKQSNNSDGTFTSESTVKHGKNVTVVSRVFNAIGHSPDEKKIEEKNSFDSAFIDWVAQGGEV